MSGLATQARAIAGSGLGPIARAVLLHVAVYGTPAASGGTEWTASMAELAAASGVGLSSAKSAIRAAVIAGLAESRQVCGRRVLVVLATLGEQSAGYVVTPAGYVATPRGCVVTPAGLRGNPGPVGTDVAIRAQAGAQDSLLVSYEDTTLQEHPQERGVVVDLASAPAHEASPPLPLASDFQDVEAILLPALNATTLSRLWVDAIIGSLRAFGATATLEAAEGLAQWSAGSGGRRKVFPGWLTERAEQASQPKPVRIVTPGPHWKPMATSAAAWAEEARLCAERTLRLFGPPPVLDEDDGLAI